MMKNSYPRKYALMPLEDYAGIDLITGFQIIKPYAYIVAECYLINQKIVKTAKFEPNKIIYEVVFTWDPFSNQIVEPQYVQKNYCVNSTNVDRIFDNLEEAIKYSKFRNNDLRISYMMKKDIELKPAFLEKVGQTYNLEQQHLPINKTKVKKLK